MRAWHTLGRCLDRPCRGISAGRVVVSGRPLIESSVVNRLGGSGRGPGDICVPRHGDNTAGTMVVCL